MKFDLASDLHIDHWDKDQAIDWKKVKKNDILVVAGDVADTVKLGVEELKRAAQHYKHVLFIDGNHDLDDAFPMMEDGIDEWRKALAGIKNVHYLHDAPFVKDGVAFIGRNGWWDFRIAEPYVTEEEGVKAFADWHSLGMTACDNLIKQAEEDAEKLASWVDYFQDRKDVQSIVVVTHTPPHPNLVDKSSYPLTKEVWATCYGNRSMVEVPSKDRLGKIKMWLFGHNHEGQKMVINHLPYLSHPRGRPKDITPLKEFKAKYNQPHDIDRQKYKPRSLHVPSKSMPIADTKPVGRKKRVKGNNLTP